jgi:hypothetical protein
MQEAVLRVCCEWQVEKALGQKFANVVTLARHKLVVKRVTVAPSPLCETSSTQYAAKRVPRGIGAIAANETPGRCLTLLAILRPRAQELKPEKKLGLADVVDLLGAGAPPGGGAAEGARDPAGGHDDERGPAHKERRRSAHDVSSTHEHARAAARAPPAGARRHSIAAHPAHPATRHLHGGHRSPTGRGSHGGHRH